MNLAYALIVSKRLQTIVAALILLAAAQLTVASCTPEEMPMGAFRTASVKVPIQR